VPTFGFLERLMVAFQQKTGVDNKADLPTKISNWIPRQQLIESFQTTTQQFRNCNRASEQYTNNVEAKSELSFGASKRASESLF
jgi:hypothetical protein